MAVTLTNLTDRAKQLADLVGSTYVSPAEWTTWINSGMLELYDLIIQAYEDYFTVPTTDMTITTGSHTLTVPADFYKLRGVDFKISSNNYLPIDQYQFRDRGRQLNWGVSQNDYSTVRRYRLVSNTLNITPEDNAAGTYMLWYIPALTQLVGGSDTLAPTLANFGWEQYIVYYAALQAKVKGEEDIAEIKVLKDELSSRIISMVANRNADQPERITDMKGLSINKWEGLDW